MKLLLLDMASLEYCGMDTLEDQFQARINPWNGSTTISSEDFSFEGDQHIGMSGCAVLNGCNYVGMAHANVMFPGYSSVSYSLVISASAIQQCISKHKNQLQSADHCTCEVIEPKLQFCP